MIDTTTATRRRSRIGRLLIGGSLAAAALAGASPALAQVNGTGTGVFGAGSISTEGTSTTVNITANEALVDWDATDADVFLPDGSDLQFFSNGGSFTVLNRIAPVAGTTNPLAIDGFVSAVSGNGGSGNVWFYNPNGFVVGANANFDVSGLVLTASPITTVDTAAGTLFGTNGEIGFGQTLNPDAAVTFAQRVDSNISLGLAGSYLAVVAPRIEEHADIYINGSAALVAAEAATISMANGLFDISVDVGTTDANGIVHDGDIYGDQPTEPNSRIYMVAVPKNDALTMLVTGAAGYFEASTVDVNDGRIVLSAGYDIVNGQAAATGTAGGNIFLSGFYASSAVDASATDTITIDNTLGPMYFEKEANFLAGNLIDVDVTFAATSGSTSSESGSTAGFTARSDLNFVSSGTISVDIVSSLMVAQDVTASATDLVDINIDSGGGLDVRELTLQSIVAGTGALTAGDVSLSVSDGFVFALRTNLRSIAYSDGVATGGTVTLETTGANASIEVIDTTSVWSMGFGIGDGTNGARGVGGTAQVLASAGSMLFGLDPNSAVTLDIRADGGPGVAGDAAGIGGSAQGGTALLSITGGDVSADGINVYARGLSYILFDGGNGFGASASPQAGDGTDAIGGNATVSIGSGSLSSFNNSGGSDLDISATGSGGFALGSTSAGGTGGTGQGGTAQFLQTGGTATLNSLGVDASGMGGSGSFQNFETGELQGDGGAGTGGTALVQLSGGTLTMFGGITARADGNPRNVDPVFGTLPGSGGSAFNGMAGNGGAGTGGNATVRIDGGSLVDGGLGFLPVIVSATGYGGAGGSADSFLNPVFGGTGGTGTGGTALFDYVSGTLESGDISVQARGVGGTAGADGSFSESGQYAGADGGDAFGGTATFRVGADFDATSFGQQGSGIFVDASAQGGDGAYSQTGTGGTGGNAMGGSGTIEAVGADLIIASPAINADGYGGSGGDTEADSAAGGVGGNGAGGTVLLSASAGGSITEPSGFMALGANGSGGDGGNAFAGTGGLGGTGTGGTVAVDALGGSITADLVFLDSYGGAGFGGGGLVAGADGGATGGTIAITATEVGGDIGSLQIGTLFATAAGILSESMVGTGTIVLTDMTSGTVSFDQLSLDSGYDSGLDTGGITVISTLDPIAVTNDATFRSGGDLTFQIGATGGLLADGIDMAATGDIVFTCLDATCGTGLQATSGFTLDTEGSFASDGVSFGSTGTTDVFVNGDMTLTGGATASGAPLFVNVFGSLSADGALVSSSFVSVFAGGDLDVGAVTAGTDAYLYAADGGITVGDLSAAGFVGLEALSIDVGSSGALAVGYAYAYDGDIVLTTAGDLTVNYGEASGDIVLTSTGGDVTVSDLYAGSEFLFSEGSGGQGLQAVVIPMPGTGNIAINAFGDANLLGTVSAPDLVGVDAGGMATIGGLTLGRRIIMTSSDLDIQSGGQVGLSGITDEVTLYALGDAAFGSGVVSPGYLLDGNELTRIFAGLSVSLNAGGALTVGDASVFAGEILVGDGGNLFLTSGSNIAVVGGLELDSTAPATLLVDALGDLYIDSATGSVRVRSGGVPGGSLFLYGNRVIAGSDQTLSDIANLPFAERTNALSVVDGGDGRSLIEGGSIFVDAGSFYVQNTGADTTFDARRGILANSMTVTNSRGALPAIVINGVVGGQTGLDTAYVIGFPLLAAPLSSVNGCTIGLAGACGTIVIETETVKQVITQKPPHSVLDGEPRSTIETRIVSIDTVEPEGFQPLIDEPVTGTGNDDLWQDGALDGKQCPVGDDRDDCEDEGDGGAE